MENSGRRAALLVKAKLPHEVLNAKQHAREAEIVADAGKPGQITIATNMAGRGTDIVLGGRIENQIDTISSDESLADDETEARIAAIRQAWETAHKQVKAAGGLRSIGNERHDATRNSNQLRGGAGRPGA